MKSPESFGDPDLKIMGLSLWIHGRQFPDAVDYWDGNWLLVTAYCEYPDSAVRASGSIVHLGEVFGLLAGCESLYNTLKGRAALDCMEPNLRVVLAAESGGRMRVEIGITNDHMKETHQYIDECDQTFLPPIISACRQIINKFPLIDPPKQPSRNVEPVERQPMSTSRPWWRFW